MDRLSTLTRAQAGALPPFRLTRRDREIVRAVRDFRVLTTVQVEGLFFTPTLSGKVNPRCQQRLKLLFHHGFLTRDEQPQKLSEGRKPLVYALDQAGDALLAETDGADLDWASGGYDVSWPFLDHLLATNDVRVAITVAVKQGSPRLARWLDDATLKGPHLKDYVTLTGPEGGRTKVAVVPDGYFALETDEAIYHHFLEIDRATVVGRASDGERRDWTRKVHAYRQYLDSGRFEERYGGRGLRILTVTTGERRLANLLRITEAAGGRSRFWFTTFARVSAQTVLSEPIWRVAASPEPRRLME